MYHRKAFTPFMLTTGSCLAVALLWGLWPAKSAPAAAGITSEQGTYSASQPIQPIAEVTGLDPAKVALGKRLFHDTRLSQNDTVSCASCHNLSTAGVDGRPRSLGIHQREGDRNAPTVFNAALNYKQFWDGRAASLEAQMDGPLQAKAEMGSDWNEVTRKLQKDPQYITAFRTLYPRGIQASAVKDAIATFERSLITTDAPFDQYLRGNHDAISPSARRGYKLFQSYGCVSCHQGANVGGNMMQPFGVIIDPALIRRYAQQKNRRLVDLTKMESEWEQDNPLYKVPSLRNVTRTAPYFHDGSVSNLPNAVKMMGLSQLGRRLPEQDVNDLLAFLESLTGKYEGKNL